MLRMSQRSPVNSNMLSKEKDDFRSLNLILPHLLGTRVRKSYSLESEMMFPTLRKTNSIGLSTLSISQANTGLQRWVILLPRVPTWTM